MAERGLEVCNDVTVAENESDERAQYKDLASAAFSQVPELLETLVREVPRAHQARIEVLAVLSAGRDGAAGAAEVQRDYADVMGTTTLLCDSTLEVIGDELGRLRAELDRDVSPDLDVLLTPDVRQVLLHLKHAELSAPTVQLFTFFALITLAGLVEDYIAACERYLDRSIDTHEYQRRLKAALEVPMELLQDEGREQLLSAVLGPLGKMLEIAAQIVGRLTRNPLQPDIDRAAAGATEAARLVDLRADADAITSRLPTIKESTHDSISVVVANHREAMDILAPLRLMGL
ncbi:MAG TPA: hypothetical protein VGN51_22080 [Acidimicrobiia bacterium]